MFKLRKEEEDSKPRLQGDEFDVFPDLGDRPRQSAAATPEVEEPEEDPPPTELQEKVAAIPDDKWKLYQLLAGILLGSVCVLLLTFGNRILDGNVGAIIAFGIAIVLPNIIERQIARTTRRMRIVMAITLAAWILISVIYGSITPHFFNE